MIPRKNLPFIFRASQSPSWVDRRNARRSGWNHRRFSVLL